jgi:hypothetical protein
MTQASASVADEPPKRRAHLGGDQHVGVAAAKHHDRIAGRGAVGARAQTPPHAERIDDHHQRAALKKPLDESLGRIGLARTRCADDRDPVVELLSGQWQRIGEAHRLDSDRRRARWAGAYRYIRPAGFEFTFHSVLSSRKTEASPASPGAPQAAPLGRPWPTPAPALRLALAA